MSAIAGAPVEPGGTLQLLLPRLVHATGAASGLAFTLSRGRHETLRELTTVRLDAALCRDALLRRFAGPGGGAAPLLPVAPRGDERNRPVPLHLVPDAAPPEVREIYGAMGVVDQHALRLAVCDGTRPLGYVTVFRPAPFDRRRRQIFSSIAPQLRVRLHLEQRLAEAPLVFAALDAALEALGSAAFIVDQSGRVVRENSLARALLARDPCAQQAIRACATDRGSAGFATTRLSAPGMPDHFLAVGRVAEPDFQTRVSLAGERWGLTPRQQQVLALVAEGRSNRAIAAELDCADKTVEIHVSALLDKVACATRVAMVAKFWAETSAEPVTLPIATC